jgi:hypothetical protein
VSGDGLPDLLGRLGLTAPGQALIFVGATAAFLAAPDVDFLLLRLLHHRSILTHSILLPLLVWWLARELGPAAAAGAFLGVAVHLAADLLSPARGYGAVWLPEPVQRSLGGWSRPWLGANALAAAFLAAAVLPDGRGWQRLAAVAGVAAAVGYGIVNERSAGAVAVGLLVVAAGWWAHRAWAG